MEYLLHRVKVVLQALHSEHLIVLEVLGLIDDRERPFTDHLQQAVL